VNEQRDTYEATKARLEEISAAARGKDVTLEKSIELLEEAVRLANLCTEHVDQVETFTVEAEASDDVEESGAPEEESKESEAVEASDSQTAPADESPDGRGDDRS
jgi:exodeoxyribonuclease VII small subunit